jgi:hypothetical protein
VGTDDFQKSKSQNIHKGQQREFYERGKSKEYTDI